MKKVIPVALSRHQSRSWSPPPPKMLDEDQFFFFFKKKIVKHKVA